MPLDDVAVKARPLIDPEHAVHAADNATDDATNDSTDRSCGSFTFAGPALNASGHTLSRRDRGNKQRCCKQRARDNSLHRISSFVRGVNDKPTAPDRFPRSPPPTQMNGQSEFVG